MRFSTLSLPSFIFTIAFGFPSAGHRSDFRGVFLPSVIAINQSSPAYAALQDTRSDVPDSPQQKLTGQLLRISIAPDIKKAEPAKGIKVAKVVQLKPMIISEHMKVDHLATLIKETEIVPKTLSLNEKVNLLVLREHARQSKSEQSQVMTFSTQAGGEIVVAKASPNSSVSANLLLSGPLTLTGGAAITSAKDEIKILHKVNGETKSVGQVNQKDGSYNISVPALEGVLLAEARASDGRIFAEGSVNLKKLVQPGIQKNRLKIPLELTPVRSATTATVVSSVGFNGKVLPVANARLRILNMDREIVNDSALGIFKDNDLIAPSSYVLRGSHSNFWPTLMMSQSGSENQMRLFPKSLVKAFLGLVHDPNEHRRVQAKGIVWGRVTYEGSPVEGAQVILPLEPNNTTHYFSGFLPDKNRKSTSVNGEFAIPNLSQGEKILEVIIGNKKYWSIYMPVELGHVTYAEINIIENQEISFMSYDLFSKEPIETILSPAGQNEELYVPSSGYANVKLDKLSGATLIETPGNENYVPMRLSHWQNQKEVILSQIRRDWLNRLQEQAQVTTNDSSSVLIGVVEGDDFEVLVAGEAVSGIAKTVYFDETGKMTEKGQSGGGYAIFNLPHGLRNVILIPNKSKSVVTKSAIVDGAAVYLQNTNLMN